MRVCSGCHREAVEEGGGSCNSPDSRSPTSAGFRATPSLQQLELSYSRLETGSGVARLLAAALDPSIHLSAEWNNAPRWRLFEIAPVDQHLTAGARQTGCVSRRRDVEVLAGQQVDEARWALRLAIAMQGSAAARQEEALS